MATDKEIAIRSLDLRARGQDYPLLKIPGYREWSERKLAEGESADLIANLDATAMFLRPEDIATVTQDEFEEMLADLKDQIDDDDG
ncbi:hypothetical protein IGB42_03077 [Andreprevotia sp. IGB-42]|uniref:hypothetical protein n=1 Tax=Andreprevotia sp. IGB-42 TaxID=2497473 RepID=UPI0013578471|nr:hypothetical protein [Andreprevotia sp. IGB-42]KAF0812409.1 hypothetical protein IGB42_03077 [Andreprevotia sp. IGB-42]